MARRRATHMMAATRFASIMMIMVPISLAMAMYEVHAADATPSDGCCATCIGKTSSKPYTYDPLVYSQCDAAKGVCCFNCQQDTAATASIENAVFGADGTTPEVKAGEWIQISWANIARVTYETYQKNQVKTTTVKNGSAEAKVDGKVFFVCAKTEGKVVLRGWGTDACTMATTEYTIQVVAGSGNGTCAERTPTAPTKTTAPATTSSEEDDDPALSQCNVQRASINMVDGKKQCVCASEWTGPPDCSGYPWWKILVTIGGGIAAVLSIAVSVKAFMNSRKAKDAEAQRDTRSGGPVLGEESITIAGNSAAGVYTQRASDQIYQLPPSTVKARDHKEYSL